MTRSARSSRNELSKAKLGPSARVAAEYESTDGNDAAALSKHGRLILDTWQTNILKDWMAIDAGAWVHRTCGLSVPRQNGKTALVAMRAATGMLLYHEEIIYTAHLQKTATETFEELQAWFDTPKTKKYVSAIKTALGREQIILKSGGRMKFIARTRNGGRGQHGDLLIFDEAQELDDSQQGSFIPAISASRNPQTIYLGTPPESLDQGLVFRDIRQKALDGITKSTSWTEYSVPEIGDITSRSRWEKTNPALGKRILYSTIEGELEQMQPEVFARERLGWWEPVKEKKVGEPAIPPDLWNACKSNETKPSGKTAYGVKFSADGMEVCLCGAVIPADGPARISMIRREFTIQGIGWLADWLNARYKQAACVVIDGRNGVDLLVDKISDTWRMKGSIVRPGPKDMIAAASFLVDSLAEGTVTWYAKQQQLSESALSSVKRNISGGWGFGGVNSLPIEAASMALWGCSTTTRDPGKKMRIG